MNVVSRRVQSLCRFFAVSVVLPTHNHLNQIPLVTSRVLLHNYQPQHQKHSKYNNDHNRIRF